MFQQVFTLCALSLLVATHAVRAAPAPPRVFLEVNPASLPAIGRVQMIAAGADLQAALDAARPGDELVLAAGERYVGNFRLPKKSGAGWITLRSSAMDQLPAGRRVQPTNAAALPKLIAPNDRPALAVAPGAGGYRVMGLEIAADQGVTYHYGLVELGGDHNNLSQVPHDLIFDRVYVHGRPEAALKRGFALNSAATVIANSYIADCHVEGQDAQAVAGWNGPGPYKLVNNYLEGSGENVMFGGADPRVPELVPADIEIRGNYFHKPLTWRKNDPDFAGRAWTVKNLLELKNARRVWIEGNVFENSWTHGQVGFAIVLTPRNQGGKAPWCALEDITFINNLVRHCSSGISILAEDDNHRSKTSQRLLFRNNLLEDINPGRFGGDGRLLQLLSPRRPITELVLERNTMLHTGRGNTFLTFGSKSNVVQDFVYRDNLVTRGQYGIHGSRGMGRPGLDCYCGAYEFTNNLIVGTGGMKDWPEGNRAANSLADVGFEDVIAGDYRLKPESPFRGGTGPGADMDTLRGATAGAISGVWP